MKKIELKDCVEIVQNDLTCVVLKVKEEKRDDLFLINGFDGNENMIKVSKVGKDGENSYWFRDVKGNTFSFSDNTLMSEELRLLKREIYNTIVFEFGIPLKADNHHLYTSIEKIGDDKKISHVFKIMGWGKRDYENNMVVHKNGCFIGRGSLEGIMNDIKSRYKTKEVEFGHSPNTGCEIFTIVTIAE
jgi:hypothetical protein